MERDDSHLTDREIDRMVNGYQDQKKADMGACPPEEDLFGYIRGGLSQERLEAVQRHLSLCSPCQDIICSFKQFGPDAEKSPLTWPEFVQQAGASDLLDDQGPPAWEQVKERLPDDLKSTPERRSNKLREWFLSGSYALRFSRALGAAGVASLVLASALLVRWYPSELSSMAYVRADPVSDSALRGRSQGDPEKDAYKDWYHHGLALLRNSQFWILDYANQKKLDEGIRYLETAKPLAEAAQDGGYAAQCSFYLGKAYLKRHDLAKAREQLEAFRRMNESSLTFLNQKREAEEILRTIQKLESPGR